MATANQVSQLFVALYNRAIDGVTAQQYGGRAYNQSFISEIIGLVPNLRTMTNQEFVELVYKNALGKDNNSDKAGIDYWVEQANTNNWRREQLTDNLLRSINAWADQNASTTGLTQDQITLASQGATVFRTKVAIAEQAATTVGGQADSYALTFGSGLEEVTFLNYNTARENNNKVLQGIAARNPLAQSGGVTLALGVNPDTGEGQESFLPTDPNPPASGASKYVASTKFDDTITGTVALTDPTFTADTQIDAGAGNDTLKLNMSTSFTGLSGDGKVTGVERIDLTNTTVNDNVTFNASGIRDVYTYVLNGANGINLTNIAYNEYLLIEMNNIKSTGNTTGSSGAATVNNGGVTQITFDTTPTGGRLDLNFNSVGYDSTDNRISNHDILFGIGSGSAIDPNGSADDFANQAAGIGILNIALTGNNYADIVNTGVNRITVGGNGSLTTNLSRGVTYFNGANATGSLNITATDKKEEGENGTNIFEYFATGSAADKVHIAVERLGQNATVNLGLGNDTLILSGEVDHEARKQFYNFNTIENLVFQDLTGDALLIDLGTTIVTTPQDPIISGSGSKKTEIPQDPIVTTTQDRSANLQNITFEDGASVQLTSLGKKDLNVTYNGATDTQKVLVDTEGTVNLVLQGSDTGAAGTGKIGAGFVNLSNAKTVNVDLTGQGFEGYLSAGNATDLNINNYTGDKKLKLKANTLTEKNDLSSVVNLTIDTEAQDINPSGSGTANSVDIANADLASISNITLKGTGGIKLGELANKEGITIAGANYSGRLDTGNIYAGPGPLSITTKGAITTGNLTGNNITIDLSKNITTTEGQYNNNIGTIYVERVDATNSAGTLNYTTGISGTQGTANADGTINDTQNIVVNTNSATLNINGAGGVDKFNIEASSFTKTLTIAGNLGTVPNYEEANNNYDTVRIDLSKTSGVNLDISRLLVSNPNNEGIVITASKGADNITLVAGANHDVVEFAAGTGANTGAREEYTVDLNNLRLGNNQSFSIDGLTISNVEGGIVRAEAIAKAIADYVANPTVQPSGFNITGKLASLTGDWAGATVAASGGKLVITSTLTRNIKDLALSFTGNDSTNAPANITANIVAGASAASSSITGLIETSPATPSADAAVTDSTVVFDATQALSVQINSSSTSGSITINGEAYTIKLAETAGTAQTATGAQVAEILNTGTLGTAISGVTITITDSGGNTVTDADYKAAVDAAGITFAAGTTTATNIELSVATDSTYSGDITINDGTNNSTWTITPKVEASAATPEIGTPESVSGGSFVWSPKALNGAVTSPATIFSMDIDGNKFSVEATTTAAVTEITVSDVIAIIDSGTVSGTQGNITYNTKLGNATAPTALKTVLDNIGVQVTTTPAGIAGNQIVFERSSSPIPESGARFSIAAGTTFANSTTTAQWSAQPAVGIPAQAGTHEVSLNGHSIVFSEVFLSAAQVRDAVFDIITKGTLSALIADGTLPSDIASKVSIDNQAYSPANAKATVAAFAIAGGVAYEKDGVAGIKLSNPTATNTTSSEIVFSQTNTADGEVVAEQVYDLKGAHGDSYGEISIAFNALKAGQSYTFDGKTIIATKDLSANQVANAFTLTTDDTVDGAVVVSDFENIDNEGVLFYVADNSGTLVIAGTQDAIIPEGINATITGTGSLGVNTSGVSASTTVQGSDGAGTKADSYVVFATTSNEDGALTAINANTASVDSISNFDIGNDGLRLRTADGGYYGQNDIGTIGNLATIAVGETTLTANVANGVISFGTLAETTAEITLDAKLYVATHNVSQNRIAGFEHNGDFYVVATGNNPDSNITTDDIVVKLTGVTGIADIATILV